jgi:hypothetical protein
VSRCALLMCTFRLQQINRNRTVGAFWNTSTAQSTIYQPSSCILSVNTSMGGLWGVLKSVPFVSASNAALIPFPASHSFALIFMAIAVVIS